MNPSRLNLETRNAQTTSSSPFAPPAPWRYIPPIAASGAVQMAIDTWLLDQHRQGLHPPTLRFYTWTPAAVSLGYHQRQYPAHWNTLTWQGHPVDLVRRPSGGRAVLHQGDLTYAVVGSGFAESRTEAYKQICRFLIEGWRSLGVELRYGQAQRGYIHNPNCFGTATAADLVMPNGVKLIGSAQVRRGTTILQHGSMRLAPDLDLYQTVFQNPMPATQGVPALPDSLRGLPVAQQHQKIMAALIAACRQCFQVDLVEHSLEYNLK